MPKNARVAKARAAMTGRQCLVSFPTLERALGCGLSNRDHALLAAQE